ncbi:MAG: flagella basal body P-ring formation protein FlgA, partial [Phycisphaerales bacterium]|nr:flagella basal body P-ring formation protein FlgA [Phycisphaerales bacterium]
LAIRRGDLVQVHCLSGGLVVRGRGRAMANGRVGELIECKLEGAERSFLARVDGPGRVVMEAVSAGEPVAGAQ